MEAALILRTATVLLAISALGGLVMAGIRFAGKPHPPIALAMLHGFLAAAAVTLLLYAAATVGLPSMDLNYHWKNVPLPKWLVVVHAIIAVLGFLLLLAATWAARG